jgi:hypothetical protein
MPDKEPIDHVLEMLENPKDGSFLEALRKFSDWVKDEFANDK